MIFASKIFNLRKKEKMSQEEFAELFNVSRQAIQKWENGTSLPEITKIVEISKYFGCSIDELLVGSNSRMEEEISSSNESLSFENMMKWEFYPTAVLDEYKQSYDEGLDVEQYKLLFEAVDRLPSSNIKKDLGDIIHRIVRSASYRKDYMYCEPSTLPEIKKLRKEFHFIPNNKRDIKDKIYGAWLGRICGCMLGKSVESIRTAELKRFLRETDNFPMTRYITREDLKKVDLSEYNFNFQLSIFADDIACMPVDDDTNYTVLAQAIFDEYGEGFTPENVAAAWIKYQSKNAYCTAERVAYRNFVKGYYPPNSATHKNPYREWIGAQIRADYWGYINPGNPEKAAEMAFRDASISHIKNGIYGEMFVAAMLAAAAKTDNMEDIVLSGLSQIPHTSRLYDDIMKVFNQYKEGENQKGIFDYIHSRYNESETYGWCHTNSNAMVVVASLLCGGGDYGKSVCMAVETGFDTDCNGATVGSVVGMANGKACIDKAWSEPINNTLDTSIFGIGRVSIEECVEKTLLHIESLR